MNSTLSTSNEGKRKYVEPYNFKQPKLFSKEIMRTLRALHDVLARNLSRVFSTALRYKADVYLQKIEQLSTTEFIQNVESPSAIYLLKVKQFGGEVIVVMPPGFCIHLIERQSGGRSEDISENRSLTTIEEKIVSRIMESVKQQIIIAWEPYSDFQIHSSSYESKPENIHLVSVDPTLVAKLIIEAVPHEIEILVSYPYSLLKEAMKDSILKKGNQTRTEPLSPEELESYQRTLLKADVTVQPLLGSTNLSVDEITALKEGDLLPLNQRTDKPLDVQINGVKKMTAYPGLIRGRKAVKIFEIVEEFNEQELL